MLTFSKHSLSQQIALIFHEHQYQPFTSGVALSTGDVKYQSLNTILSDGNNSLTGDADLENNLISPNLH
jgi:hypothetical protein